MTDLTLSAGVLNLLRHVRADNLDPLFQGRRVAYIVDYPAADILAGRGISLSRPMDTLKKAALLRLLPRGSFIVSPGIIGSEANRTRNARWFSGIRSGNAVHLPTFDVPVVGRIYAAFRILSYLLANSQTFDALLCYNSYAHTLLPAALASRILRKPLYIDWQDDYRLQTGNVLTRLLWPLARRFSAGGVATNRQMIEPGMKNWFVIEAHCDLGYAKHLQFDIKPGMRFLFAGTLDRIRGAHLIPEVIRALDVCFTNFHIDVAGGGVLGEQMATLSQSDPRVEFHGFVTDERLADLIRNADACLVLQDPGQAFSRGSFPSKIQLYAKYRKPVLMLRNIDKTVRP